MDKILRILGKKGRITIPYEIRQTLGYMNNDLISMTPQADGSIVIRHENACTHCVDTPKLSLEEILEGFSVEEKRNAFVYLSALLLRKQKEEKP